MGSVRQEQAWQRWVLSGVIALAAGLRSYQLDQDSLSAYELPSLLACEPGAGSDFYRAFTGMTGYPPAFPLLFCRYLGLFGHSDMAARSFSVLAGVLLVALAYQAGRRLFSPSAGLLAALIMATDHQGIAIDRTAGIYSPLALWVAAAGYCFCRLAQLPAAPASWQLRTEHSRCEWSWQPPAACDGRYLLGFWGAAILAFYTSVAAIGLYLVVLLLLPFWWRDRRDARRAIVTPLLVAVLLWLPVLWGYSNWVMDGNLFALEPPSQLQFKLRMLLSPASRALDLQSGLMGLAIILLAWGLLKKRYDAGQRVALLWTAMLSAIALAGLWLVPSISIESLHGVVFFIVVMVAGVICQPLVQLRSVLSQQLALLLLMAAVCYGSLSWPAMQRLYLSGTHEDFRGVAAIIAGDDGFRTSGGRVYLNDPRFAFYLQQRGFSDHDLVDADREPPPALPFYFLEYIPGDSSAVQQAAAGLPADRYQPVCRTVLPWLRLSKFVNDPAVPAPVEPVDCRAATGDR